MVEKLEFQADISELMNLIIHAFYSNRDVFLREIISNASDALDKQRHTDLIASKTGQLYRIRLQVDDKKLVLEDTGIGMSREDLVENLSTIARSGTKQFIQTLQEKSEQIGQFGVGFYSVFLVADQVEVYTQKQGCPAYKWSSDAQQFYTLEESPETSFEQGHGTRILLTMKDDAGEYLEEASLRRIIQTHSSFITYPVELYVSKEIEVPIEEDVVEEEDDKGETKVEEVEEEDETKAEETKTPKTEKKTIQEWEVVNGDKPVWSLAPSDVPAEDYEALYKTLSKDHEGPLYYKHFRTEGAFEFRGILFIPKRAPFDMLGERQREKRRIRLYVKNVLVLHELEKEMLPDWMNFVVGVIDSPDLPLNVSREMLQETKVLKAMKNQIKKQILNMLTTLLEDETEKYNTFYNAFQRNVKLGIHDGDSSLLRFLRLPCTNHEGILSLDEYVDLAKPSTTTTEETSTGDSSTSTGDSSTSTGDSSTSTGDSSTSSGESTTETTTEAKPVPIYFATGPDAENGVFSKLYTEKGYRVLLFKEPLDEFMLQRVQKFGEHELVNISKEHVVPWSDGTEEKLEEFCTWVKETLADSGLEKVCISVSLTTPTASACCVVASKFGWTGNMEKIMMAQPLTDLTTMSWMKGKKIWELNATHPLVQKYRRLFEEKVEPTTIAPELRVLYRAAQLSAGYPLDNPSEFVNGVVDCLAV